MSPVVGTEEKIQKEFSTNSHSAENESLNPTPYSPKPCSLMYTNTLPITISYFNTLPNTLRFRPKPKSSRQPIRIQHEKHLNFVNQSESMITTPKNTRVVEVGAELTGGGRRTHMH